MIDFAKERLIPLKNASAIGCDSHPATLREYQIRGKRSPVNGRRVYLETAWDGNIRCTTREAYVRFLQALNAAPVEASKKRRRPK